MTKLEYIRLKKYIEKFFKKEEYMDENAIYDMIELILKFRKNKSMVDDICVIERDSEFVKNCSYSPIEKKLEIILPDRKYDHYDYNAAAIHSVFHELEHVDQHKKCIEEKDDGLESGLLKVCFKATNYLETIKNRLERNDIDCSEYLGIIEQMKYYQAYSELVNKRCYELLPSERQAEINSFNHMIEIMSDISDDKYKDRVEVMKMNHIIRKLMGYRLEDGKVTSPTYELYRIILEFTGQSELQDKYFKIFNDSAENMSLEQRLYYGFGITPEEYQQLQMEVGKRLIRAKEFIKLN